MNTSIEKSEIRTLIPHAGLMCLLDSVLRWDDESIVCVSETHRDPANPLNGKKPTIRDLSVHKENSSL